MKHKVTMIIEDHYFDDFPDGIDEDDLEDMIRNALLNADPAFDILQIISKAVSDDATI